MPVVVEKVMRFGTSKILIVKVSLTSDRRRDTKQEVRQTVGRSSSRRSRKVVVGQAVCILIIVQLATNHSGPKLNVVCSVCPGKPKFLLEHIVSIENWHVLGVAECGVTACSFISVDDDRHQARDQRARVGIRYPECR